MKSAAYFTEQKQHFSFVVFFITSSLCLAVEKISSPAKRFVSHEEADEFHKSHSSTMRNVIPYCGKISSLNKTRFV